MPKLPTIFIILISLIFISDHSFAAKSQWQDNPHVSIRLITAVDATGDLQKIPFGLEFKLKPEWKIYWRSPGDAGLPPDVDWSKSSNIKNIKFNWPLPYRFSVLGLETLGYKDHIIFPLLITPEIINQAVDLKGDLSYLACANICIPYNIEIGLRLNQGNATNSSEAYLINKFQANVPSKATANTLNIAEIRQTTFGKDFNLQILIDADRPIKNPDGFIEGTDGLYFGAPEIVKSNDGNSVLLNFTGGGLANEEFINQPLTLTIFDDFGMIETVKTPKLGLLTNLQLSNLGFNNDGKNIQFTALFAMIAIALLGGLILNLMPCVLPVLSIKLLSIINHAGGEKRHVRISFLWTAAGIIFAFIILAIILIMLKSAGMAIGWGIQFQQPLFLIAMAMLLIFFAANMFGLFEFHLPSKISDMASKPIKNSGYAKDFLSGIFATLLATPCSAPFLGSAIGFALGRGMVEILTIFIALGIGLSTPYLLVALIPKIATSLPKPGAWMIKLKYILGLLILATAIWLLSVLIALIGNENTAIIASLMAIIMTLLYIKSRYQLTLNNNQNNDSAINDLIFANSKLARYGFKISLILVIAAMILPILKPNNSDAVIINDDIWIEFNEAKIQKYITDGKIIFVDITADWCITCKYNKKTVLESAEISAWLIGDDIIAMRGDWTKPSPIIAKYLASFERYGIPFNAVYGINNKQGIALPELLSIYDIINAAKIVRD